MDFDGGMLRNCGSILSMLFPDHWKLRSSQDGGFALYMTYNFGPEGEPACGVSIYLPGRVSSPADAKLLADALARRHPGYIPGASRTVLFSETDRRTIAPVLGEMGDDDRFEIGDIWNEEWNSRWVLYVKGTWRYSGTHNAKIFVDQRGDGRLVQEIGVYGPSESHPEYVNGLNALRSIAWRKSSDEPGS